MVATQEASQVYGDNRVTIFFATPENRLLVKEDRETHQISLVARKVVVPEISPEAVTTLLKSKGIKMGELTPEGVAENHRRQTTYPDYRNYYLALVGVRSEDPDQLPQHSKELVYLSSLRELSRRLMIAEQNGVKVDLSSLRALIVFASIALKQATII